MKKTTRISIVLLVFSVALLTTCTSRQKPSSKETLTVANEQPAQRGEYLVTIMGCNDCHSPKKPGPTGPVIVPELALSGYAAGYPKPMMVPDLTSKGMSIFNPDLTSAAGPWGITFAANLTSDQSGVGSWTSDNFKRALKEGKYMGLANSRTLLPPMPWTNFIHIHDEDVDAIFAYLQSTRPVKNVVPLPIPPDGQKNE